MLHNPAFRKFTSSEWRRKPAEDYHRRHGSGSRSTEHGVRQDRREETSRQHLERMAAFGSLSLVSLLYEVGI